MKLSQYHKDAICRRINDDIPKQSDESLVTEVQAALYKAMSPECKRLYNKNPKGLRTQSAYGVFSDYGRTVIVGDANLDEVCAPFMAARKARSDLENKVKGAIYACSTRKQFIDRFPEFSKYAPDEHGVCVTLPATANLIADLVRAGWKQTISQVEA